MKGWERKMVIIQPFQTRAGISMVGTRSAASLINRMGGEWDAVESVPTKDERRLPPVGTRSTASLINRTGGEWDAVESVPTDSQPAKMITWETKMKTGTTKISLLLLPLGLLALCARADNPC